MLRSILGVLALSAAPVAHADEVTDVLLLPGEQRLWIALDGQPEALDFESEAGLITLTLTGFQVAGPRSISPATGDTIAGLAVMPQSAATQIRVEGGFGAAVAELRQGGVLIDLSGGAYRVASAQPATGLDPDAADFSAAGHGQPALGQRHSAAPESGQHPASPTDASRDPVGRETTPRQPRYRIAQPSEQRAAERAAAQAAEQAIDGQPAAGPAPARTSLGAPASGPVGSGTEPEIEPSIEVDLNGVPGETELVEAEPDIPGPCDPTAAAVASSPWDLDALAAHAACLIEIGETVNGAGLYERVLAFDPGHFQAALGLARLRERQGRRADAARLFETAADAALTDGQALAARQSARRLRDEN